MTTCQRSVVRQKPSVPLSGSGSNFCANKPDLTQSEIAQQLGISQPSYVKWERRDIGLTRDRLHQLASILGVESKTFSPPMISPNATAPSDAPAKTSSDFRAAPPPSEADSRCRGDSLAKHKRNRLARLTAADLLFPSRRKTARQRSSRRELRCARCRCVKSILKEGRPTP